MNLASKSIDTYCLKNSTSAPEILNYIERETNLRTTRPHMISGPLQGAFIAHVVAMLQAENALEIGTFTGYTAIWIAAHLADKGKLVTIEVNPEIHWLANHFFESYEHKDKITSILGDAGDVIPTLDKVWDFVLIDAGKVENDRYYEMILPSVRKGGYIMVDNVIWKSKTLTTTLDKRTVSIDEFNKKIASDSRVSALMLPIRDGITLIRKL